MKNFSFCCKIYCKYLKAGVANNKNLTAIKSFDKKIVIDSVGGCAYNSLSKILSQLEIDKTFVWLNKEEDPFFHGIGKDNKNGTFYDWSLDVTVLAKDKDGNITLQNVFDANGTLLKRYSEFDDVEYEPDTYYFSADNLGYTTSTGNIQLQFRGESGTYYTKQITPALGYNALVFSEKIIGVRLYLNAADTGYVKFTNFQIEKNNKVTEYDIYAHYLGQFKVGMIYQSPFRKDKNPSFGIFYSKRTNQLLFKDHGTGECGNVIKFVQLYTGKTNYNDILQDIVAKLNITPETRLDSSKQYIPSTETVIGVVRQEFTDTDIKYWGQFNISTKTLKKFNVNSIKYYLCNGVVKGIYKPENPMYAYKVYNNFKVYRPLGDKYTKWRNNLTEYDVQGYEQLPKKGDICIITKSLKDVMCLYEMGIPAVSPSSESTWLPDTVLEDILKRFKRVLICFDRDGPGMRNLRKISLKTGLNGLIMPKKFKAKDISDAISVNGFEKVKEYIYAEIDKEKKRRSSKECNTQHS